MPLKEAFYLKKPVGNLTTNTNSQSIKSKKTKDLPDRLNDRRDGKYYRIIEIGKQAWMAENLAFNTGNGCWAYNNDLRNVTKYGYLYSWETANSVCPKGWRLPTKNDFESLIGYVGEDIGTSYKSLIQGGNSGFSALLCGQRLGNGNYCTTGNGSDFAIFWSSSSKDDMYAWILSLSGF